MNVINYSLPISPLYRSPFYDALKLQIVIGIFGLMILDGGNIAQFCGAALLAFWGGVLVLICRFPQSPTYVDLKLIQFGYIPLVYLTGIAIQMVWELRGLA